jgi:hypothetical protein
MFHKFQIALHSEWHGETCPPRHTQYMTHLFLSSVPTLAHFTRIHKYNNVQCILLLFNVGNVLLCVIYQLNFIIGMYVNEKRLIYIGSVTIRGFGHPW